MSIRATVVFDDRTGKELKRLAANERRSVSSLVCEAVELYLKERKRKAAGEKLLAKAGKVFVSDEALDILEQMRDENDRF